MSQEYPIGPLRSPSFRWRAFAIHVGISLAILGVLLYVLFVHWFPGHLFDTDGGWQVLQIIIGVDLVLGPLLTLVAASPGKTTRELRKDFTVIALIQVAALAWGTWMAWHNRPYAMIWVDGDFNSMPYSAFAEYPEARERISALPGDWPKQVMVRLPADLNERSALFAATSRKSSSVVFSHDLYAPFSFDDLDVRAAAAAYASKLLYREEARADLVRAGLIEPDLVTGRVLLFPVYTRETEYHLAWRLPERVVERHDFLPYTAFSKSRQQMAPTEQDGDNR